MPRCTYYSGLAVKVYLPVLLEQIKDRLAIIPNSSMSCTCSKVFDAKWFHTDNFTHVFEYTVRINNNQSFFYTDTDGYLIMIQSFGSNHHHAVDSFIEEKYFVRPLRHDVLSLNEPDVQEEFRAESISISQLLNNGW